MGFFKKLINKFNKKEQDKVADQISKINAKKRVFQDSEQVKFDEGLRKSSTGLNLAIKDLIKKHQEVNEEFYEALEDMLIMYDIGYSATLNNF